MRLLLVFMFLVTLCEFVFLPLLALTVFTRPLLMVIQGNSYFSQVDDPIVCLSYNRKIIAVKPAHLKKKKKLHTLL